MVYDHDIEAEYNSREHDAVAASLSFKQALLLEKLTQRPKEAAARHCLDMEPPEASRIKTHIIR